MLGLDSPRWRVRLVAASWVAVVAAIPAYIAAGTAAEIGAALHSLSDRLTITLIAIFAAAVSGYWIGWRLIDPKQKHAWYSALFFSASVWLLAYYLFAVPLAAPFAIPQAQSLVAEAATTTSPTFWTVMNDIFVDRLWNWFWSIFVLYPALGLQFGVPWTGWYTLPVALIAGYILSRRYRGHRQMRTGRQV